jgi:hypothetical protein
VQQDGGQVDRATGPMDVGGLRDRDLPAAQTNLRWALSRSRRGSLIVSTLLSILPGKVSALTTPVDAAAIPNWVRFGKNYTGSGLRQNWVRSAKTEPALNSIQFRSSSLVPSSFMHGLKAHATRVGAW